MTPRRETPRPERSSLVFFAFLFLLLWTGSPLEFFLTSPDHGYQLSLGRQVVYGKFPFVDLFFHYGPLTAFTSAVGIWVYDSLVSEVALCALGYATALCLLYRMSFLYTSRWGALLISFTGLVFISRFYKWYYWLFPLLTLYLFHLYLTEARHRERIAAVAGLVAGTAAMYRFDLGLASLCFFAIALTARGLGRRESRLRPRLALFFVAFALPLFAWLLALSRVGGAPAIGDYFRATLDGSAGAVAELSLPFPTFDWREPLSFDSGSALLFLLVPSTSLVSLVSGLWLCRSGEGPEHQRGAFMAATGLMALGVFPQALHRSDLFHLLQTLPSFLLAAGLLLHWWWKTRRSLALGYLLVAIPAAGGVWEAAGGDQGPLLRNPLAYYSELVRGIDADLDHPVIRMVREVKRNTGSKDAILVASIIPRCELYYFADRSVSGLLTVMAPGVLDNDRWRLRNLRAVRQNPPAVVIARANFFQLPPEAWLPTYQPELYTYLKAGYRRVLYDQEGWLLLSPAD